jgi:sugar-specific transcriptional regulator TrmB
MDNKQFLKEFGFTKYETDVFLALVRLPGAKASELAKFSHVPSNKVYECLIRLAEKGFVASLDTTPRQYKIIGVGKFQELIEQKEKKVNCLKTAIKSFESNIVERTFNSNDLAMVFRGKKKIVQKLEEITPKIKNYQYSLGGNLVFTARSGRNVKAAIKRGVDFRFIVHYDSKRKTIYEKWKKLGVKIRFHPKNEQKSIRFSTFDGTICRLTFGKPEIELEENYLTFWLESPAFASLLKDQFLVMWGKAKVNF